MIVSTPVLGWCSKCCHGWDPERIAVPFYDTNGNELLVCDRCIEAAHSEVHAERQRREAAELARRGEH